MVLASGCKSRNALENEEVPPELTFDEVLYRVYRGPLLAAEGTARRATFRRDTTDAAGEAVIVRFPPTADRGAALVTAARVDGNLEARRFVATGGVHAEEGGQVADTERARYDAADGVVRGDQPTTVRSRGFVATGNAFTLDPRETQVRLEGGARVVAGGRR
jgi:hypothetical protein